MREVFTSKLNILQMDDRHKLSEIFDMNLQDGHAILQNIITKERVKITQKSSEIIRYIRDNKTTVSLVELREAFREEKDLKRFYDFLIAKRILFRQ